MEEIIKAFHVDLGLLIAQAVNFLIVLVVLWFLVSKPLIKLMQNRTTEIKEGLDKSEKIKEEYVKLDDLKRTKIKEGKVESEKILARTNQELADIKQAKLKEVQEKTKEIIDEAKLKIENERAKMQGEVKTEIAELVLLASGKITNEAISKETHQDLIDQAIKDIESSKV